MNVLALATMQDGITAVWTLPASPLASAPMARVPGGDTVAADALVNGCKGDAKSWQDWAGELAEDSPYLGSFSIEDVPDPMDAQAALGYLRRQVFARLAGADTSVTQPPLQLTTQGTGTKEPHNDPSVMYEDDGGKPGDNCGECYMSEIVSGVMHCSMVQDPITAHGRCRRYVPKPVP